MKSLALAQTTQNVKSEVYSERVCAAQSTDRDHGIPYKLELGGMQVMVGRVKNDLVFLKFPRGKKVQVEMQK